MRSKTMQILVIGGTGFIGSYLVRQLIAGGHTVAVLHRQQSLASLPAEVNKICGDRHDLSSLADEFKQLAPDIVIDLICYTEAEAAGLMQAFSRVARRVVVASSQDVYRAYGGLLGLERDPPAVTPL